MVEGMYAKIVKGWRQLHTPECDTYSEGGKTLINIYIYFNLLYFPEKILFL